MSAPFQVEAQFPAWISRFLSQPQQDGAASFILQREDLQAELQALEHKILAKVLEDRRLTAREAQAGIGVALRQGGTAGVTEEVSAESLAHEVSTGVVCAGGWHVCLAGGRGVGTAPTAGTWILSSQGARAPLKLLLCHSLLRLCLLSALEGVTGGNTCSPARLFLS